MPPCAGALGLCAMVLLASCSSQVAVTADAAMAGAADYHGVWGANAMDVYVVGSHGTILHGHEGAFAAARDLPDVTLYGVSGALGRVLVVGERGTILRSVDGGASWSAVASGVTVDLRAVSMLFGGEAWVVGDAGTVLVSHDGGASFARETVPTAQDLRGVSLFSDGDAFEVLAVGRGGAILRHAFGQWTLVTLPSHHDVHAVWATAPFNTWAGVDTASIEGTLDTIVQPDGAGAWRTAFIWAGATPLGLGGTGGGDVYCAASLARDTAGIYFHRGATGWEARAPQPRALRGAWAYGGDVYLVGDAATILHNPTD